MKNTNTHFASNRVKSSFEMYRNLSGLRTFSLARTTRADSCFATGCSMYVVAFGCVVYLSSAYAQNLLIYNVLIHNILVKMFPLQAKR